MRDDRRPARLGRRPRAARGGARAARVKATRAESPASMSMTESAIGPGRTLCSSSSRVLSPAGRVWACCAAWFQLAIVYIWQWSTCSGTSGIVEGEEL